MTICDDCGEVIDAPAKALKLYLEELGGAVYQYEVCQECQEFLAQTLRKRRPKANKVPPTVRIGLWG